LRVYTVSEVAKASGVSVRALHHYDEIGLLKPGHVGENGYRYYGRDELLRLQQVLFHRELGLPLEEIRRVLDDPGFDRVAALRAHRVRLMAEAKRYRELDKTLDATLSELEGETDVKDQDIFKGFDANLQAEHEAWLVERYGDQMQTRIDEAKAQFKGWTQAEFDRSQAEFAGFEIELAEAMSQGLPADSEAVKAITRRIHAWIGRSWNREVTAVAFNGLAAIYEANPGFRERYEARAVGLTDYLAAAVRAFADTELA
jgi:DNA-binding transcriptional MerR regulator